MIAVPQTATDLVKQFEGLERRIRRGSVITVVPYRCPAGFWTIGYGHLCNANHPPISKAEADAYLLADLDKALAATLRCCPVLLLESEKRLAAMVDFCFNLGAGRLQTSTLRRRVNQRDWNAAAQELRRWIYAGGKVLPGLVARRETEVRMLSAGS